MSRDQWLSIRKKTIGGSDAAGIVGLSRWATPFTVWADKTGRLPDSEDSEAMRLGRDLEDYVARRWMEQSGKRVRRLNAILYNPQYPFAHADVDRMVIGENAGLECKTTSTMDIKQFKGVDFPEKYYTQCVHYMAVTGAHRWYLAVLVLGRAFFHFTLERDQAEIDALMAAEKDFWNLVQTDTPPCPDGADPTKDALHTLYPDSDRSEIALFGREAALGEYLALKEQRKILDVRMGEIENIVKNDMKLAQRAFCGTYEVTWSPQPRRTFQTKAFQQDHPDIDLSPYYKENISRPFKVTEIDTTTLGDLDALIP